MKTLKIKQQQWWLLAGIVSVILLIALLGYISTQKHHPTPLIKHPFSSPLNHPETPQTQWLTQAAAQVKANQQRTQALQAQLIALQQQIHTPKPPVIVPFVHHRPKRHHHHPKPTPRIVSHHFPRPIKPRGRDIHNYVPAGTFAQAILLGGADASASVNTQSNPTPMLLRILSNGTLPNQAQSHLKGCFVTAAVIGDISAERGKIRLETLSCTDAKGHVFEQQVAGTVFGSGGKNGVRGRPVWRESQQLKRAFLAGSLSSASHQLLPSKESNSHLISTSIASGSSHALERLASYHIHRAEQYHPVIQLNAGSLVDIVFLKGFYWEKPHENTDLTAVHGAIDRLQSPQSSL